MTRRTTVTIKIPKEAELHPHERFMDAARFEQYCSALGVNTSIQRLEACERSGLLMPVARIVLPRALRLHRDQHPLSLSYPMPAARYQKFIEFEGLHFDVQHDWDGTITEDAAVRGHPIERALNGEVGQGVVEAPSANNFRAWRTWRFPNGFGGQLDRATHYYSPWQVIVMHSLDVLNGRADKDPLHRTRVSKGERLKRRFLRTVTWDATVQDIDGPTHPVNQFRPAFDDVVYAWPSPWVAWAPWFERVASFAWRVHKSLSLYGRKSGSRPNLELWQQHLGRQRVVAAACTAGTERKEWIRLLRALTRLDEQVEAHELFRLQLAVRELVRNVAVLLMCAYGDTLRTLSDAHDGGSSPSYLGPRLIDGTIIEPGRLWAILDERSFDVHRRVRPFLEDHFQQLQKHLRSPLPADTAQTLFETLASSPDNPLLTAIANYQRVMVSELDTPWGNRRRWSAVRGILVALDSESCRWFLKTKKLIGVLQESLPGWGERLRREQTRNSEINKVKSTDHFVELLGDMLGRQRAETTRLLDHADDHAIIAYVARNWSAHHGRDPDPWQSGLAGYVVTCALRTALVIWQAAREKQRDILTDLYPESTRTE
jgi:hypothetical protein